MSNLHMSHIVFDLDKVHCMNLYNNNLFLNLVRFIDNLYHTVM
jgi:predicted ATPase